jgi:hypothetical protein
MRWSHRLNHFSRAMVFRAAYPRQGSRSLGIKPESVWVGPLEEQEPGDEPTPLRA